MPFPSQILISLGSGKPDPHYQEGDPINVYPTARIAHCNLAGHICNPRTLDRLPNGAKPYNSLARRYLDIICPYRWEETATPNRVIQRARDGSVLDAFNVPDLNAFFARIAKGGNPRLFGPNGKRVFYDQRRSVTTRATATEAWAMVETHSVHRRAHWLTMRHSRWWRKNGLIVRVRELGTRAVQKYIEEEHGAVSERGDPILTRRRRYKAHWERWNLGMTPAQIRDRTRDSVIDDREVDEREIKVKT